MHADRARPAYKLHAERRPGSRKSPSRRLEVALLALCAGKGAVTSHRETPWASITFAGTRHEVIIEFLGKSAIEAAEAFIEQLPEHEFSLPGQLVADAAIAEVDHQLGPSPRMTITTNLLLLEES